MAAQHPDLDLDHVEPAGVLGGVVELEAAQDAPGFGRIESLVEGAGRVARQVVLDDPDRVGVWIVNIDEFAHALGKVEVMLGRLAGINGAAKSAHDTHARLRTGAAGAPLRGAIFLSSRMLRRNACMRLITRRGAANVGFCSRTAPACLALRCASSASS